ncbi:PrgI family protein [Patescibacteria group bacterium]
MQFKVPQDVQRADKIIGPLTLKHMIIIGAGGGLAYIIYTILSRSYFWEVWLPPVGIILVLTAVIAFVKIFNVSFGKFVLLFIEFNIAPRQRKWFKASGEVIIPIITPPKPSDVQEKAVKKKQSSAETMGKLDDLSHMLDTYGEKIEKS